MTGTLAAGLALALFSAITSAFAHATLKSGDDKLAVMAWIRLCELATALPFVLWIGLPPGDLWLWIAAAVAVHALYQLILSWSYTVSDFTAAYPIARGFTPIFTALLGIVVLGDRLDGVALAGIAIISAGILALARSRALSPTGLAAACATGLLTTCYTLVDAKGVRAAPDALTFIAWFYLICGVPIPLMLLIRSGRRTAALLAHDVRPGIAAGVLSLLAFAPALFALGMAPVGAVAALRETSVLIGLVLGAVMLKERLDRRRITGGLLVTAGTLTLIAGAAFA
ncbi:MAG TPA: DMT family transporter [Sphingobium sp.]|nr:DMT family transporter [Sphingobium sp.]